MLYQPYHHTDSSIHSPTDHNTVLKDSMVIVCKPN